MIRKFAERFGRSMDAARRAWVADRGVYYLARCRDCDDFAESALSGVGYIRAWRAAHEKQTGHYVDLIVRDPTPSTVAASSCAADL